MFELKNGRRKKALRDQQVANAAGSQLALNQQMLSQQVDAALDPAAMQALATGRTAAYYTSGGSGNSGGNAGDQVAGVPFNGGGAGGLPAGNHHPSRRRQHDASGRDFGGPQVCPHQRGTLFLPNRKGLYVQYGVRREWNILRRHGWARL